MANADRFEYKFLLTRHQREGLLAALGDELKPDTQGSPDGRYPIVSLYYDSPDLRCYWDKWRGVPSRRKLRVRVYGTTDGRIPVATFIEVKHKADGRGAKRRVQVPPEQTLALLRGEAQGLPFSPAEQRVLDEVRMMVTVDGLQPTCLMRYDRHAYFLGDGRDHEGEPLRITFDDNLSVRFDDLSPKPDDRGFQKSVLPPEHSVVEIKGSGAIPYPLAETLTRLRILPRKLSKYGEAIRLFGLAAPRAA